MENAKSTLSANIPKFLAPKSICEDLCVKNVVFYDKLGLIFGPHPPVGPSDSEKYSLIVRCLSTFLLNLPAESWSMLMQTRKQFRGIRPVKMYRTLGDEIPALGERF